MTSQRMLTVVSSKNGSMTAVAGVGHQDHVRLVDALPAGDRGAVEHLAVAEQVLVDEPCRDRDVLFLAARVGEAQVRELHLFFFYELQYITGCHIASGKGVETRRSQPIGLHAFSERQVPDIAGAVPDPSAREINQLRCRRWPRRTTLVRPAAIIAPISCEIAGDFRPDPGPAARCARSWCRRAGSPRLAADALPRRRASLYSRALFAQLEHTKLHENRPRRRAPSRI